MSSLLNVVVDTSQLEQWATELSQRGVRNAIRRAVDQSATAARRVALDTIAKDIGVPKARIKDAVSKVRRTTQTNLSASFTATKAKINILATAGATISRGGGLTASTFRLTGGGSASLNVKDAFIVEANGGRFVAIRRGKERLPIKGVFAESPGTAMGQDNAAAQVAWRKAADAELSQRLPREIQRQFFSEKLSAAAPADTGD
jgi:hypothetical protein